MSYKEYICFFYDFRASGKRESKISIAKDYYMFKKEKILIILLIILWR